MTESAYDQPETAAGARLRNAEWGLERVASYFVHCATGGIRREHDSRESLDHTLRVLHVAHDELWLAREAHQAELRASETPVAEPTS